MTNFAPIEMKIGGGGASFDETLNIIIFVCILTWI
jgi:hypothetical protein